MSPRRHFRAIWSAFGHLAARRSLMVFAAGLLTMLGCIAIDLVRGHDPIPEVHDENAYLLAADTFARGRLTNPSHPLWRSLETFHVLQRPTCQAKYPPGQGLFLALGTVVGGRPIVGVWISASLFASALCWMLQGWFGPRWAVLGTIIGIASMILGGQPLIGGINAYWSQSYWGGAVGALGGALLIGGVRRVFDRATAGAGAAIGLGAAVLALSRPYEGLLLCLAAGAALAIWLVKPCRDSLTKKLTRVAIPAALVLSVGLGWLALYNLRVTGSAAWMPYMEYREQYQVLPIWVWQDVRAEPPGLNREMLEYARWELATGRMLVKPARRAVDFYRALAFEVGPILAPLMLLGLPWTMRSRRIACAAAAAALVIIGMSLTTYFEVHYRAPAAPLTVILATALLRRLALIRSGPRRIGPLPALLAVLVTLAFCASQWISFARSPERMMEHWAKFRVEVDKTLADAGGEHVVFVRYGPRHGHHIELVHNTAEVDAQDVVWVRELDAGQNRRVLEHFAGRTAWLVFIEDDQSPARMGPLPLPQ